MTDAEPQTPGPNPPPPGRPPFAPPPGTPFAGRPQDASWAPPPGSVFAGGPDAQSSSGRDSTDTAHSAAKGQEGRAVPFLLAVAAIVAAIVTARAALLASDATGQWQRAVAQEQRRGAMLLEGVRYTYGSEGDMAMMIVVSDMRAQELRAAAAGQPQEIADILEAEAEVQQQLVDLVGPNTELYADPRYRLDSGGVNLQLRLADARATEEIDDPLATLATADVAAEQASRLMLTTLLIAGAFLFGALAQTFARRRRMLLTLGWLSLAAGGIAAVAVELGIIGTVT